MNHFIGDPENSSTGVATSSSESSLVKLLDHLSHIAIVLHQQSTVEWLVHKSHAVQQLKVVVETFLLVLSNVVLWRVRVLWCRRVVLLRGVVLLVVILLLVLIILIVTRSVLVGVLFLILAILFGREAVLLLGDSGLLLMVVLWLRKILWSICAR